MSLLRSSFIAVLVLIVSSGPAPIAAQDNPASANQVQYPDSESGLKKLFQDILDSVKAHDTNTELQLIHSLILPKDTSWFKDVFGAALGETPSAEYKDRVARLEDDLHRILEADLQKGWTNIKARKITDPGPERPPIDNILNDMDPPQALYQIILTDRESPIFYLWVPKNEHGFQTAGDPDGYFFYIEGQFRFMPTFAFVSLPDGRPEPGHEPPPSPRFFTQSLLCIRLKQKKLGYKE